MCERPCHLKARNVRNCRVRSDVEENLVARQHARPAVIQTHLERLRRHKTTRPHDQFGAARPVVLQVIGNQAVNHVALAPANRRHVDRDGTGRHAELRGVVHQMRDLRAPNLILAGQAGDVGAGAPDPPALHDGGPPPGLCHMPSQELATRSTAKDQDFKLFWLSHEFPPCAMSDPHVETRRVCASLFRRLSEPPIPKRRSTNQYWATPPSTINSTPVTYALSSEARNTAALAISSGVPMRSRGIFVTRSACALSSSRTSRPGVEM